MPTRRQLEVFCQAAVDLNFRDAGDRLGMSQAAVSGHIHALERRIGRQLFVRRRGTTAQLSEDGARLLETARRTLELNRRFVIAADAEQKRRVVIGLRHFLLETSVRAAVPRFLDLHRDIDLQLRVVDDVGDMARQVRSGALDAAFYRGDPPTDTDLVFRVGAPAGCSIYGSPDLVRRLEAAGTPLDDAPFILLPRPSSTSDWIGRRCRNAGIEPRNVVLQSQFPDVVLHWVLAGRGVAILFDFVAKPHLQAGKLERVGPPIDPVASQILAARTPRPEVVTAIDFLQGVSTMG